MTNKSQKWVRKFTSSHMYECLYKDSISSGWIEIRAISFTKYFKEFNLISASDSYFERIYELYEINSQIIRII